MNLKTDIDFDLKHFFQWWGRELSHCLPEKLKQKLSDKSGHVFLSVKNDILRFDRLVDGEMQSVAKLILNEKSSDNYQRLIAENKELEKADYVLRLTSEQAIKKVLHLPAAAKENLQQVVAFELDRVTPFTTEQVYFAVKIVGKEEYGKIKVLLVLTPEDILDTIYQQLNSTQIYPEVVDYSEAPNDFSNDLDIYNLLPEWERPVKDTATQMAIWGLSFIAIALAVAVLVYPVWQKGIEVDGLRQQLKTLESDTHLVQSQQMEIDAIIDETERIIKIKNNAPVLAELINVLSQLMADDTWLTHFKFNKDYLQIQGQSPTASALISVLEASPLFSNARFVSPLTQDKKTGLERFQIRMDLTTKGGAEDE